MISKSKIHSSNYEVDLSGHIETQVCFSSSSKEIA